jgi:hypothetical protein
MTTYRLFPATNGPSSPVPYTGNILVGVLFRVTQGGMWFTGYWKWVATGEDVTARKFALWHVDGAGTGTLLPAATVTSGTLTAGQWNFVALSTPIQLSIGSTYNACTGWAAVTLHGFSDSDTTGAGTGAADSYGSGGHTSGITSGPLFAFSDQGFSAPDPFGNPQGVFSTAGTDATVNMPFTGSNNGNFWMDASVSDTAPAGYAGTYRLWPNTGPPNPSIVSDAPDNYEVATEIALSQACVVSKLWYYSPSGATQLATAANIWSITGGGLTGTLAATNAAPSWSGAAASGWISCTLSATLPAGKYKAGVYNGAASPAACFAKDAQTDYWRNGIGASGVTNGPISAPQLSAASLAYNYNGNAGGTPAFSDGTTLAGQGTFTQGPPDVYPYLVALVTTPTAGSTQNYWADLEVTPAVISAGLAAGTGTAQPPVASVTASAGLAAGTGTAQPPGAVIAAGPGRAPGAGTAQPPAAAVTASAGRAPGAGTAQPPAAQVVAGTGLAAGAGASQPPAAQVTVIAGLPPGAGTAWNAVVTTVPSVTAAAGLAAAAGTAQAPVAVTVAAAGAGTGNGTAQPPSVASSSNVTAAAGLAAGTGTAPAPGVTGPVVGGHSIDTAVTELASMRATVT